ncbi:MAG: hypothetical protein QNK35_02815 [Bacteroides sp.]|nr:hypothetical protein [Bacteroides sp.]
MNKKLKKVLFWVLAVVISLSAMVYQRMTGPTYPKDYTVSLDGSEYKFALPRTHGGETDCPLELELPEPFQGQIVYRKFPSDQAFEKLTLERKDGMLTTTLPHQPPAGKLEYHLVLTAGDRAIDLGDSENVVIRFKGAVPAWALIPHVLLMVLTVIWSTATILFAFANMPVYKRYVGMTLIFLILGGFIMGPVVQKFSFGAFWTGWPVGDDLTDNKTMFALIAFVLAWFLRNKSYGKWLAVGAAVVMLVVYLIPHSMNGSELDIESGEVVTGSLILLLTKRKLLS